MSNLKTHNVARNTRYYSPLANSQYVGTAPPGLTLAERNARALIEIELKASIQRIENSHCSDPEQRIASASRKLEQFDFEHSLEQKEEQLRITEALRKNRLENEIIDLKEAIAAIPA